MEKENLIFVSSLLQILLFVTETVSFFFSFPFLIYVKLVTLPGG